VGRELKQNSYAIYIVHYPFVIWIQYHFLGWSMAAEKKAVFVFIISLALSWSISVLLRQISGVKAVI
jgi:surface polysaccharide O-acyltransferase-like enzyme